MTMKKRKLLEGFNRFQDAADPWRCRSLTRRWTDFCQLHQLKSFERDKVLEAAIHRDFQEMACDFGKGIQ